MHARTARTRDLLHAAVLELAGRAPIATVTASAVCAAAGVTRDTFYRYAVSPVALLAEALGSELDAFMTSLPVDVRLGAAERGLLEHVAHRAAVYRGAMQPALAAPVRAVLETYLRDGLVRYATLRQDVLPPVLAEDAGNVRLAAAYAASGTVGAIEEWLNGPADDIDRAVQVILLSSAPWWMDESDRGG